MKIPQFIPAIGADEYQAIASCFETQWITEGPKAKEFSERLLELTGAKYGVFAPNGTLALYLALKSAGIGPGDQVIVPDFTFIGTANAVEMTGATPVFADVNIRNFQIDISSASVLITSETKAIMPVHIYGTAVQMEPVIEFAKTNRLMIIEDAAQAVGIRYKGKHTGTFGDAGIFSFFADKTITTGEGGFIVTNEESFYHRLLYLRNQGRLNRGTFIHPEIGYNFRMTDMQCAIGLTQLGKLEKITSKKIEILKQYEHHLRGIDEITFFLPEKEADYIPFRVCVLCKKAHELMEHLQKKDIEPRTFFYPLHKQPCYKNFNRIVASDYNNTIYGYEHGVCLPTFLSITEEQVSYIGKTIRSFYEKK